MDENVTTEPASEASAPILVSPSAQKVMATQFYLDMETQEIVTKQEKDGVVSIVFRDGRKRDLEKWDEERFYAIASTEAEAAPVTQTDGN